MQITNTQPGPRGVNAVNGPVLLDPHQTVDVQVYERERQHLEASGWFTIEGDFEPNPGEAPKPPMNGDKRDENGELPETAEVRHQFNASWAAAAAKAGALPGESLTSAIERLVGNVASAADFEQKLRTALDLKDGEGILEAIDALKLKVVDATRPAPGALTVLDKGRGWFAIVKDGVEVTKSLREDDVKDFDKLSDSDKLAFVDLHKPE